MLQFRYVAHSKCPQWQHWQVDQAAEPSPRHHRHVPPQARNLRALLIIKTSFFCSGGVLHLTHARCPAARSRRASQPSTLSTAFQLRLLNPIKMLRIVRASQCARSSFLRLLSMGPVKLYVGFDVSETRTFSMEDVKHFAVLGRDS